jgi:phosphoesterase RecJ-like protein
MWREIKKVIHQHQSFLLTTHINPDGDGIGSACALIELLKMMDKTVQFVCDSPIPSKFQFLDFHSLHHPFHPDQEFPEAEVLIMVDTHNQERIGRLATFIENPKITTICIDHHELSETVTSYSAIDPHASSTGSMIYTLFKECGYDLNLRAAMGIYASIVCDTGRFCYSSTDRKAHKIAEECIKKGVDPDWMYAHLFRQVTLSEFKILAKVLENMEIHCDDRILVQQLSRRDCEELGEDITETLHSDLEYVHEFNKHVVGIECAVLLRDMQDGTIRISLRSHTDIPIDELTRSLGGGGHQKAAGATVKGTLEEVKLKVITLLSEALQNFR